MSTRVLAVLAVVVSTTAFAQEVRLRSARATQGSGAELLFDGKPDTGWQLAAEVAEDEGVMLRLLDRTTLSEVQVVPCPKSTPPSALELVVNGGTRRPFQPGSAGELTVRGSIEVQTLFIHVDRAERPVCLGELRLLQQKDGKATPVTVKLPRAVKATLQASSTLDPAPAYHPSYAFDGRVDSGWVEGNKSPGDGESLTVTFESEQTLDGFDVWNGYQRSKDHFEKNGRVVLLSVQVGDAPPVELPVKDVMGVQHFQFPGPLTGKRVSFTVKKARKGKLYADLVVSELQLSSPEGLLELVTPDAQALRQALLASIKGKPLERFVDVQHRWSCSSDGSHAVALKLRGDHTFVAYLEDKEEGEASTTTRQEVFDGRWVVKSQGTWSVLELFGRRHRVTSEEAYSPYVEAGGPTTREVVSGGKLEVAAAGDVGAEALKKYISEWQGPGGDCLRRRDQAEVGKELEGLLKEKKGFLLRGAPLTELVR